MVATMVRGTRERAGPVLMQSAILSVRPVVPSNLHNFIVLVAVPGGIPGRRVWKYKSYMERTARMVSSLEHE